jgi:hypothetical protein
VIWTTQQFFQRLQGNGVILHAIPEEDDRLTQRFLSVTRKTR